MSFSSIQQATGSTSWDLTVENWLGIVAQAIIYGVKGAGNNQKYKGLNDPFISSTKGLKQCQSSEKDVFLFQKHRELQVLESVVGRPEGGEQGQGRESGFGNHENAGAEVEETEEQRWEGQEAWGSDAKFGFAY